MRCTDDLSPCDSRLVFFEYAEEHPLLLNNIGMAFKIKTYYRRPEVGRGQEPPADGAGGSTTLLNALHCCVSRLMSHCLPYSHYTPVHITNSSVIPASPTLLSSCSMPPHSNVTHPCITPPPPPIFCHSRVAAEGESSTAPLRRDQLRPQHILLPRPAPSWAGAAKHREQHVSLPHLPAHHPRPELPCHPLWR